ncbi:hypothetical protein NB524_00195 [Vibrio alginolyticus]|uniref:hypothetical protein n=1 Tax=Vibrio alginolyticus TaxID=663 RepID=UPI00215C7CE0|nr:hypothetical protein [Vibrio alginolyticus]EKL9830998.1 hypothetical protein [Vibrio alginolyticus]MCR9488528.1 hypothetical protein [Vibrio alginolyticus]MCR9568783.1 hypothetical protein [Vibrio alginolyticus]
MSTSMRTNEYKLRQKEIDNPYLSDEQKQSIRQLLKEEVPKRLINMMYGTSYKQLKSL